MMDYRPQIKPYWAYAPEEHRCPTECDLWCPYSLSPLAWWGLVSDGVAR
jgi:hypothetical protein